MRIGFANLDTGKFGLLRREEVAEVKPCAITFHSQRLKGFQVAY